MKTPHTNRTPHANWMYTLIYDRLPWPSKKSLKINLCVAYRIECTELVALWTIICLNWAHFTFHRCRLGSWMNSCFSCRTSKYRPLFAKTPLQSRVRQTTHLVVMCTTSQCRLRYPFQNLRVTNVIFIVTYYTLPSIESSPSFWMTRSQRSRRHNKGLWCSVNLV